MKSTIFNKVKVGLIIFLCFLGAVKLVVDSYVIWYNWKYREYDIEATTDIYSGFKYIPKFGYHLEAICEKGGEQIRLLNIRAFTHFDMITNKGHTSSKNCEIIIVQDVIVIPPLKDYNIAPPSPNKK